MMKITGLSHLFKWENLHNWWLTKYFFAPLYVESSLLAIIIHPLLSSHIKSHNNLLWTVFACKQHLIYKYVSPDSDETTFSLEKAILWI